MQQEERQLFREKAEQLADAERKIYSLMQNAGKEIDQALDGCGMPNLFPVVIPAVILTGLVVAAFCLRDNGIAVIVLVLAMLYMAGKVYSGWQNYSMRKDALASCASFSRQADEAKKRRERLLEELNRLRRTAGDRRYWWDAGLDPAFLPKMPGQKLASDDDWRYDIFHEVQLETREDGIYLHDFLKEPVFYRPELVESLRTGKTAELYRDDGVYSAGATAYVCQHLYAYQLTPIQEIKEYKTVQKVDRRQVMEAYRARVDELEKNENFLLNGNYDTNESLYLTGRTSFQNYDTSDTYRRLAEYEFENRIPSEITRVQYTQGFHFLWALELFSCAMIFIAADGACAGQTALILMPNEKQNSVYMTVRTKSALEFCGYLESYVGMEPLAVGGFQARPWLASFAGTLFGSRCRRYLKLGRRDVLAGKPHGLTDEEWVYLIRMDREAV